MLLNFTNTVPNLFVEPSEPLLLEIDTIDSTSVTLKWMPPETCNGAITGYSIKYGENCINKFGGEVSDKMIDTVKGLSPDTVYIFELKAHTRVGAGPPFTLTVTTCKLLNSVVTYILYMASS